MYMAGTLEILSVVQEIRISPFDGKKWGSHHLMDEICRNVFPIPLGNPLNHHLRMIKPVNLLSIWFCTMKRMRKHCLWCWCLILKALSSQFFYACHLSKVLLHCLILKVFVLCFSPWLVVNMKSLATPLPRQSYQWTGANEATRERKTWNQNLLNSFQQETV